MMSRESDGAGMASGALRVIALAACEGTGWVIGNASGDDKCAGTGEIPRKAVERELQRWLRTLGLRER